MQITIHNWNESEPLHSHGDALMWPLFTHIEGAGKAIGLPVLQHLLTFHYRIFQVGEDENYHNHDYKEQIYFIIKGRATMHLDGKRQPVRDGDAVFMPVYGEHQMINNSQNELVHLIISAPVTKEQELREAVIRNWSEAVPTRMEGTETWTIYQGLPQRGKPDAASVLEGFRNLALCITDHDGAFDRTELITDEVVYFVLQGNGAVECPEDNPIREGDAIHIPPGMSYRIRNTGPGRLQFLRLVAPVTL